MKNITVTYKDNIVSLLPVESTHKDFLLKLFKECRPDLALITSINEKQTDDIIYQQFTIEQEQLIIMYPNAEYNIVIFNGQLIGRLYINHGDTVDRILEIGLLDEYRSLGIGKELVTKVIQNALKKNKSVNLQVAWFNNMAYEFYEKMGFEVIENKGVFYEMQYAGNFN